ncbi:MAG: phosphoglycerate kinase [Alphaproteobacteria bacterium]
MAQRFKTLDDLAAEGGTSGKTVLVRLDLNVPTENGTVTDATRIERSARTLKDLAAAGARVVMLSHFGRPKGQVVPDMSLQPVVQAVADVLGAPVAFAEDCVGEPARRVISSLSDGTFAVLENTRFHAGEEKNDPDFTRALAALGDVFVADAFSAAHRAHASTEGLAHHLPTYAGRAMEAELAALETALTAPDRPVVAVVGGAKISSKLDLLNNLIARVDKLVIGGGMANTFLAAEGTAVGASLCEHDLADTARAIMAAAKDQDCEIILPADGVVAREFRAEAPSRTVPIDAVGTDDMILDVGTDTVQHIARVFDEAKTVVWNGPLGAFEITPFDNGTNMAARHAALLTRSGRLTSVAGGGDTVAALNRAGASEDFTYISTAGGAFLEWLEGKSLPGVEILYRA